MRARQVRPLGVAGRHNHIAVASVPRSGKIEHRTKELHRLKIGGPRSWPFRVPAGRGCSRASSRQMPNEPWRAGRTEERPPAEPRRAEASW